jgi:hypothetical protein
MALTLLQRGLTVEWRRLVLERGLELAAGVALAVGLVAVQTGGGIRIGSWVLPVREFWRPLAGASVLLILRALVARRSSPTANAVRAARTWMDAAAVVGFTCGIVTAVLLWSHYEIKYCGGADSFGYVSAAHAIVQRDLIQPQPIARWLPFPGALEAATPAGWAPAPSGDAIVPGYPLGFPLAMAALIELAGPEAAFQVPLLAGIGILIITWRLTRQLADATTAAAATLVVAFNPELMNMVIMPMSDVPASFWYLLAVYGVLAVPARLPLAGVAFGLAIWTRPALLVTLPALVIVMPRARHAFIRFAAGLAPVLAVIGAVQWWLYGNPMRTGYGGAAGLFSMANAIRNVVTYAKWIVVIHSPLFIVAFAAGVWRAPRRLVRVAVAGFAIGVVPYLFKLAYYDDFDLLRYLLPILIPCLVVATIGVTSVLRRYLARPAFVAVVLAAATVVAGASYRLVAEQATFHLIQQESAYAAVGAWFHEHTPPDSVILAVLHAGSLRFYGHRTTLRSDLIPAGSLAATVNEISRRGIGCFAAVDGAAEDRDLRRHFGRELDRIVSEPIARVRNVMIYRLRPRP